MGVIVGDLHAIAALRLLYTLIRRYHACDSCDFDHHIHELFPVVSLLKKSNVDESGMATGDPELLADNSITRTLTKPHHDREAGAKPRGPFRNKRSILTTRITNQTRRALEEASRMTGRSLSQEIEVRLEQSFLDDEAAQLFRDRVYGRELGALLELLGKAMQQAGRAGAMQAGAGLTDWLDSPALITRWRRPPTRRRHFENHSRQQRCLILADGFSELQPTGEKSIWLSRSLSASSS